MLYVLKLWTAMMHVRSHFIHKTMASETKKQKKNKNKKTMATTSRATLSVSFSLSPSRTLIFRHDYNAEKFIFIHIGESVCAQIISFWPTTADRK